MPPNLFQLLLHDAQAGAQLPAPFLALDIEQPMQVCIFTIYTLPTLTQCCQFSFVFSMFSLAGALNFIHIIYSTQGNITSTIATRPSISTT